MTKEQFQKNLTVPSGKVDVIIDTDAYNEIDDQFAISYLLKSDHKLNTVAIYAAPFLNDRSVSPKDGMEKSYDEILRLLKLCGEEKEVFKGSETYLPDENTFVDSPAARDLAKRAEKYSPEKPLYVVAIGAITNIASALIMNPSIAENIVIVWLGGHALHYCDTAEFNMRQDVSAARVVFRSEVPLVQLPCMGVVDKFAISKQELEYWFVGKNPLSDYLAKNSIEEAESYAKGTDWTRVIWDVTAVAWLLNEDDCFMKGRIIKAHLPGYDNLYWDDEHGKPMMYVYNIDRDNLMNDLIERVAESI